jgi:adenine-specific DNA-methyltransferase
VKKEKSILETKVDNKSIGQFFTNQCISDYMASIIDCPLLDKKEEIRILDAGAGKGILTSSAALHLFNNGFLKVHASLYEIDLEVLPFLEANMQKISQELSSKNFIFSYEIHKKDFILTRPDKQKEKFHLAIINPPYFKYSSKKSIYSEATKDLFKGNPNIYASFMAVTAACLNINGQMIAIVPRSFTSGLYFKGFRSYLMESTSLEHFHIFKSRDRLFKDSEVLQENIICKLTKRAQNQAIKISSSNCYLDLKYSYISEYPSIVILGKKGDNDTIRIPEDAKDEEILRIIEKLPSSFLDNQYYISTGPVVEHRTREYINNKNINSTKVPLLRMHNIKPFCVKFDGDHKKDAYFSLISDYKRHVQANETYVLLKRFSSKEEKRRLTAGINDPLKVNTKFLAIENHINYVGIKNEKMELEEAFGIASIFNSTIMDRYFRSISGSTQVNATDIRMLRFPTRREVKIIGKKLMNLNILNQENVDQIINQSIMSKNDK